MSAPLSGQNDEVKSISSKFTVGLICQFVRPILELNAGNKTLQGFWCAKQLSCGAQSPERHRLRWSMTAWKLVCQITVLVLAMSRKITAHATARLRSRSLSPFNDPLGHWSRRKQNIFRVVCILAPLMVHVNGNYRLCFSDKKLYSCFICGMFVCVCRSVCVTCVRVW